MAIRTGAQISTRITGDTFSYIQTEFKKFVDNSIVRLIFWIAVKVIIIEMIMHMVTYMQVNEQLGFNYATPVEDGKEVFVITQVVAGEAMFEAGFQVGDYVLFRSVDTLYYRLVSNQERETCIPIEREGAQMFICLRVPTLKLTFPPELIYWLSEK